MTTGSMPGVRASEMPVTVAANGAGALTSKDAAAPATGKFAAVLEQRSAAAQAGGRPASGKRTETRGPVRKDAGAKAEDKAAGADGKVAGAIEIAGMPPASVLPVEGWPFASADADGADAVGADAEIGLASPVDTAGHEGGASVAQAAAADLAGAGGLTADQEAREVAAVGENALLAVAQPGMPQDSVAHEAASGAAGQRSSERTGAGGQAADPASLLTDSTPSKPLLGANTPVGPEQVAAVAASPATGAASGTREAAPAGKSGTAKSAGVSQRLTAGAAVKATAGQSVALSAESGPLPGTVGENWRGQHDAKGEARPGSRGSEAEGAGHGAGAGAADAGTDPSRVAAAGVESAGAIAAASTPLVAGPVPVIATAIAHEVGGRGPGKQITDTGVGSASGMAAENAGPVGPAEGAPLTAVGAARLLKTVAGSELRVGTQSADLGAVTIRTVLGREQMQAHISFENERMGSALSAHLLGGSLEDRLGQSLGVRASVTLSAGTDAGTGHGGREAARDGFAGQMSGSGGRGSGAANSDNGSGHGAKTGSGRYGPATAGGGLVRPALYGGPALAEGRLDIRV